MFSNPPTRDNDGFQALVQTQFYGVVEPEAETPKMNEIPPLPLYQEVLPTPQPVHSGNK